ncbi:unnamed protein product, partial [Rotaria magnacalcarata]
IVSSCFNYGNHGWLWL